MIEFIFVGLVLNTNIIDLLDTVEDVLTAPASTTLAGIVELATKYATLSDDFNPEEE